MITNKITKNDLKEIYKISLERFGSESWNNLQLESALASTSNIFFVLKENNKICSFILAQNTIDSINILLLATTKPKEKHGYATSLLNEIKNQYKNKNIWLEVKEDNLTSIQFYKNNGFKELYKRNKYYKDGKAAIILELKN